MANGWSLERRARQAELIRSWRPWERSTGPRSAEGKTRTAHNADKGGHRQTLRELSRMLNAEIKAHRDMLDAINR